MERRGHSKRRYLPSAACRFDETTRPYQFALQARAGTDCLASLFRVAVEMDLPPPQCRYGLDDLYIITSPPRLDAVSRAVEEHASAAANLCKTRIYDRLGGEAPPGIPKPRPEVWRGEPWRTSVLDAVNSGTSWTSLAIGLVAPLFLCDAPRSAFAPHGGPPP